MHLSSPGISKTRRCDVREFLGSRNATVDQIRRKFFSGGTPETDRKKANRFLCKERKRKRIRIRGVVQLNANGRPELAYGKKCRIDELEHEVLNTEAELLIGGPYERNVPVGKTIADAATMRNGIRFFVEVDNETMSPKQMREKWSRYKGARGFILLVCRTKSRLKRLIKSARSVKGVILFTRFHWLRCEHLKRRWIDTSFNRIDLESWGSES